MIADARTFVRRTTLEGGIAEITLDRPEKRNALSLEVMRTLIAELDAIGRDHSIAAVLVRHEGPVFSAGHDIREMIGRDVNAYREIFDVCSEMMQKIQQIPQPVIAEVSGIATAAGCQFVASCDLAIASDDSKFATPGVKIGLFCTTPMVALTRAIGRKRAMEMLVTGEFVDATNSSRVGSHQPRGSKSQAARRSARTRTQSCGSQQVRDRPRQSGILRADRSRPTQGVRLRERSHEHERARRRCARRHVRFR